MDVIGVILLAVGGLICLGVFLGWLREWLAGKMR